jgi:crotonobetainyl-CoA:carnitine CoA-transferase CaiB-like acyl-CoA transferase
VRHRDQLVPLLAEMVRTRTKREWIDALEAAGVPCGPINTLAEVFENEQVIARGLEAALPHPSGGTVRFARNPIRMSATPPTATAHPPLLGEHTVAVLRDMLGYDDAHLDALRQASVI